MRADQIENLYQFQYLGWRGGLRKALHNWRQWTKPVRDARWAFWWRQNVWLSRMTDSLATRGVMSRRAAQQIYCIMLMPRLFVPRMLKGLT